MTPASIGAPTLLSGFPKSGTTLVTSLLDGHPDLLCFPEETWALKTASRLPPDEWLDHVLGAESVSRLGRGQVDTLGGVRDYRGFDFERFEVVVRRRWASAERSARGLFESVMTGFAAALDAEPTQRWVEKSPEQELWLDRHAADWDDLRVVHVVRDPRAVLCSFRRKRERSEQHIYVDGLAQRWRDGLVAVLAQERRRPGSVVIVRYEDVVTDHRATLGRILRTLGVAWHDAVERPTLFGRSWAGNSMYQSSLSGITTASLERWTDEIDPRERAVLETCLSEELAAFGYDGGSRGGLVRDAVPLVLRQRPGVRAKGRALRRLMRLRDAPPAPVDAPEFERAFRGRAAD